MQANKGELAKAMVEAGLNGGTLAIRVGCSPVTISRLRNGGRVDRKTAMAICFVLDSSLDLLFQPEEIESA